MNTTLPTYLASAAWLRESGYAPAPIAPGHRMPAGPWAAIQLMYDERAHPDELAAVFTALPLPRGPGPGVIVDVKATHLVGFLKALEEKALVFTQYLRTLRHLEEVLTAAGHRVAVYHGSLSSAAKDTAVRAFRGECDLFLSTEAGGEGRNLQFARTVVNYDLPWNPLRIEQRIGRVHRLGQEREVHVVNLWAPDTVEAYLVELLDRKIHMFELVVGELDLILGQLDERRSFEDLMLAVWTLREDEARRRALDHLGDALVRARSQYDRMRERNEEILGEGSEEVAA